MNDNTKCATCGFLLPEPGPQSPEIRYCETHWWEEQQRKFDAGEPISDQTWFWLTYVVQPGGRKPSCPYMGSRAATEAAIKKREKNEFRDLQS